MSIKETPTNFRVYYKSMINAYTQAKEDALRIKQDLIDEIAELRQSIVENIDMFKREFGVDLNEQKEFVDDKYTTGTFFKLAKGLFINRDNNYIIVSDLFDLYNYARKQKELNGINKDIELYNKILKISLHQYTDILKTFYNEVHKKLILDGCGYVFEGNIGWTCINRCHIQKARPHIDFAATKKRKAELKEQGKRLYNREEAEWCKKNGIEYDGVDGRVYLNDEYCYEIPLIDCKLPKGSKQKLTIADYRGRTLRGKSNEDIAKEYGNNKEAICELDLDIRTKLNICNEIDKMLYLNFIRNENQEPINAAKISRKNR